MILQSIRGRTQEALPLKRPPGGGSGSEFTDASAPFNDEARADRLSPRKPCTGESVPLNPGLLYTPKCPLWHP